MRESTGGGMFLNTNFGDMDMDMDMDTATQRDESCQRSNIEMTTLLTQRRQIMPVILKCQRKECKH